MSPPQGSVHPRLPQYKSALVIAGSYHALWSHVPTSDSSFSFDTIRDASGQSIEPVQSHRQCLPPCVALFFFLRTCRCSCVVKLSRCDCIRFSPDSSTPPLPWMHSIIICSTLYQEVSSCHKCKWKLGSLSGKWVWWWQRAKATEKSEIRLSIECCWILIVRVPKLQRFKIVDFLDYDEFKVKNLNHFAND